MEPLMFEHRFGLPLTAPGAGARGAIAASQRALPQAVRIGGSRAQPDPADATRLAAQREAGHTGAASRIAKRRARRSRRLGGARRERR